jgi:hypothetical protein
VVFVKFLAAAGEGDDAPRARPPSRFGAVPGPYDLERAVPQWCGGGATEAWAVVVERAQCGRGAETTTTT